MRSKSIFLSILLGAVFLMPAPIFAQQAPMFFDAFLFDNAGQPAQDFNLFFQWEVTNGTVDLLGGNVPGATDQTTGRFVELAGTTGNPGMFATRVPFNFAPGMTYNLRFDYKSSDGNPNAAQVSIGSQTFNVSTSSTALQTFSQNFTFGELTSAKLIFQDSGAAADNAGIGIDNVILSIAVIEPPLFFDAFLFDNAGQPANSFNTFIQWDVTDGTVDLLGGNVPGAVDQTNGRFVELGGSTNNPGMFATKLAFPFAANVQYNLRFDYKSSDGLLNSAQARIGTQIFTVTTASTELQVFNQSFTFPVTVNEKLVFQNLEANIDNAGIGIDNVILSIAAPTAASVTVGGRVTTTGGRGIRNVTISMTDASGSVRTARTTAFGYYSFADVPAGQTYIFNARAIRYRFAESSRVLFVNEDVSDVNFTGTDSWELGGR